MEYWRTSRGLLLPGRAPVRRGICSMLMVNQLVGFGVGGAAVQTLIDRTLGTRIGDMTGGGGLAAAFDGNTNQTGAGTPQTAYFSGNNAIGYVGKDWGSGNTKIITGFVAYASSDRGFNQPGGTANVTITLQGSTDNFSSSTVDLGSVGPTANSAGLVMSKLTGLTTTTAYRYHRLKIDKTSGSDGALCAECQFYEDI